MKPSVTTLTTLAMAGILVLSGSVAEARKQLSYADGVVRLEGMATGGVISGIRARDYSLYIFLPRKGQVETRVIKTPHKLIRFVGLQPVKKGNKTRVELALNRPAKPLLGRLRVYELNGDVLIAIRDVAQQKQAPPPIPAAVVGADVEPPPADQAKKPASSPAAPAAAAPGKAAPGKAAPGKVASGKAAAASTGPAPGKASKSKKRTWGKQALLGKVSSRQPGPSLASFWILFLVIGLGGGVAWWLKRRKRNVVMGDANIDIVSCKPLSGKHRLLLVDANNELLLLGCTDREIRLLRVMGPARSQQSVEREWFERGDALDQPGPVEPLATERPEPAPAAPPAPDQQAMSSFMTQLTRQIERREQDRSPAQPQLEPESEPLDERWAEGIIRLRKERRTTGAHVGAHGFNGANGANGNSGLIGNSGLNGTNGHTHIDLVH